MAETNGNGSYSSYTAAPSASSYGDNVDNGGGATLRRRNVETIPSSSPSLASHRPSPHTTTLKKFDFMFPKVDTEYTVTTERGGVASLVAYGLILLLVLAETATWMSQNKATNEHIRVDTSLGKRMRVNINITFPALGCGDLHVDVIDSAGDAQLNVEDTLSKIRLDLKGKRISAEAEKVESNANQLKQLEKEKIMKAKLPENYCGPCYGAQKEDDECCNTCDELIEAYKLKKWSSSYALITSEQCIREGRDHKEHKKMTKGEGCNLSGFMNVNRVSGNFHVALGEGVERDGRHIHSFIPEDAPFFNSSHVIHHLSFGGTWSGNEDRTLDGVTKIVTKQHGTTGLFQYFIKVVPTTYIGKAFSEDGYQETNRYFFVEKFRPLMKAYVVGEDDDDLDADGDASEEKNNETGLVSVTAGHSKTHSHSSHHAVKKNAGILPGIFFMYEIYPFAIEISRNRVPVTHLLIRIMAMVGGVFTIGRWADSYLYERERTRRK